MSDDLDTSTGPACVEGKFSPGAARDADPVEVPMRRRRFLLTGAGATGLMLAETLFGRTAFARASDGCACCNLISCPPNLTYQYCTQHCNYIWTCVTQSGRQDCYCCEIVNCQDKSYTGSSAYSCV